MGSLVVALGLMPACGSDGPPAAAATAAAENLLADLEVGAWHAAFSRLHPQLQAECRSAERLRELLEVAGERPSSWTLRPPRLRRDTALVTGAVVPSAGGHSIVELTLLAVDGTWQVRFWSAGNRELCREDG